MIRHAPDVISSDRSRPRRCGRAGTRCGFAIDASRAGEVAGVVSAGNTGALMAIAKIVRMTLPEIDRPALVAIMPSARGDVVMLDLGANVAATPQPGRVRGDGRGLRPRRARPDRADLRPAQCRLRGAEGRRRVRAAADILRESHIGVGFHGFVEGHDITAGTVDVVVTDGFTGNVALKTGEGALKLMQRPAARGLHRAACSAKLGYLLARPALDRCASGSIRAATTAPSARPQRHRGEEPWRRRRAGLRQCGRRRHRHGAHRLQRPHPGRAGRHAWPTPAPQPEQRGAPSRPDASRSVMTADPRRIAGCGGYLPERVVTNDELAEPGSTPPTTGSSSAPASASATSPGRGDRAPRRRRRRAAGARAPPASRPSVDLIIVATTDARTDLPGDRGPRPAQAGLAARLRLRRPAACSGFVYALGGRRRLPHRPGALRPGDRRRDLLPHPRLDRPRHLRAVRRRRRRGGAGRRGRAGRRDRPRHPLDASALRRAASATSC